MTLQLHNLKLKHDPIFIIIIKLNFKIFRFKNVKIYVNSCNEYFFGTINFNPQILNLYPEVTQSFFIWLVHF